MSPYAASQFNKLVMQSNVCRSEICIQKWRKTLKYIAGMEKSKNTADLYIEEVFEEFSSYWLSRRTRENKVTMADMSIQPASVSPITDAIYE